jgi:hypothetical protein
MSEEDQAVMMGDGKASYHSIQVLLGKILAELPAIGKNQENTQQGFRFRGHDDVMKELNPLLGKYGVVVVPNVRERLTSQRTTRQNTVMFEVNLLVGYTFYGPGGDSIVASVWGEGTDSGDKATNKAMTMAFKNVLAQVFAVSTEEGRQYDADYQTVEETQAPNTRPDPEPAAEQVKWWEPTDGQRRLIAIVDDMIGKGQITEQQVQSAASTTVSWPALVRELGDGKASELADRLARFQENLRDQERTPVPEGASE